MDIAGYTVIEPLGRNALSTVYLAKHAKVKGRYVIRHLSQQAADDSEVVATFLKGANQATEIIHPQLVRVYQYGQHMGRPFCIMEHVVGDSLAKKRESMCLLDKIYVVKQTAKALAYLAKFNLPHLNVNPANIYLKKGDTSIVLAGFGFDPTLGLLTADSDQSHIEAAHFLSPEQLSGAKIGLKSDIFSLGAVFYWLLTGSFPVRADSVDELKAAILRDGIPAPELSANKKIFAEVLLRMLEQEPSARYKSMTDVLDELDNFSDEDILAADSAEEAREVVETGSAVEVDAAAGRAAESVSRLSSNPAFEGAAGGEFAAQPRSRSANVVSLNPRRSGKSSAKDGIGGHELSELLEEHPEIFEGPKKDGKAKDKTKPFTVIEQKALVKTKQQSAVDPDAAAAQPRAKAAATANGAAKAKRKREAPEKASFTARAPHQPPRAKNPRAKNAATKRRKPAQATQKRGQPHAEAVIQTRRSNRGVLLQASYLFLLLAPLALGIALILASPEMQQQVFEEYILPIREAFTSLRN